MKIKLFRFELYVNMFWSWFTTGPISFYKSVSSHSSRNDDLGQQQLLFTTRLSATKSFQIYSSQRNYLQLDKVD